VNQQIRRSSYLSNRRHHEVVVYRTLLAKIMQFCIGAANPDGHLKMYQSWPGQNAQAHLRRTDSIRFF